MTTFLLIILVIIELIRLMLQYQSGKRLYNENLNSYAQNVEAQNTSIIVSESELEHELESYGKRGFELVSVIYIGLDKERGIHYFRLFFTKKKVKTFIE